MLLLVLGLWAHASLAHEVGLSSLTVSQEEGVLALRYHFNAEELQRLEEETLGAPFERVRLDDELLPVTTRGRLAAEVGQAVWQASYHLPRGTGDVAVEVTVLDALARGHRQLVYLRQRPEGESVPIAILDRERPTFSLAHDPAVIGVAADSPGFWVLEGARHIWGGLDHLAFLGVLLLPLLMGFRRDTRRGTALAIASLVTVFSIAHSTTLLLAALEIVALPARLVEGSIALSVIVAAIVNLKHPSTRPGLLLAFAFGLLHGFGFAGALGEMGLGGSALLGSMLAFNVGVELGQLAIVLGVLAVVAAPWARLGLPVEGERWRAPAIRLGSLAIAVLGAGWLLERIGPIA